MNKILETIVFISLLVLLILFCYFFIGSAEKAEKIAWGVNFSQRQAENFGLNWKEVYLALLDDLGVKNIKLSVDWDLIESEEGKYNFKDLDWQIDQADKKGAKLLLAIGMKTPRWPECHIPGWAKDLNKKEREKRVLELVKKIIARHKNSNSVWAWQVENEPFFPFGKCPQLDKKFLKKEINLVKFLDPKRPVIISESGEFPLWLRAAQYGDIVGTTMYRKVWFTLPSFGKQNLGGYVSYPFPPIFYQRKAELIKKIFGKKVICVELQAEPWGPRLLYDNLSLSEQRKTMDLEQFKKNIEFAERTGFDTFYLWGSEWWYWLKIRQGQPDIWSKARELF
jgi:hypothetical protein